MKRTIEQEACKIISAMIDRKLISEGSREYEFKALVKQSFSYLENFKRLVLKNPVKK